MLVARIAELIKAPVYGAERQMGNVLALNPATVSHIRSNIVALLY
jgi:hypothetical protein